MEKLNEKINNFNPLKLKDQRIFRFIRGVFYLIGLLLIVLGGARLMTIIFSAIMGFILGKAYQNVITVVKDYRISQKVTKQLLTQADHEAMKSELEHLRKLTYHQQQQVLVQQQQYQQRSMGGMTRQPVDHQDSYTPSAY